VVTVVFAWQSVQILGVVHEHRDDDTLVMLIKFWAASGFSIIGLLIQAAIAIYCVVSDLENTTKLALIIVSEVVPTTALAFLYTDEKKSTWSMVKRVVASTFGKTATPTPTSNG